MHSQITHIGIKQARQQGFRYKHLQHSGIFRDKDTCQKQIDCQGPFENWTNIQAKSWVFARVKEQKDGRKVHIVCNCCDSREPQTLNSDKSIHANNKARINSNCFGDELVELIIKLAKDI
ncbi:MULTISPECIES: hypothetical protein [Prochlorococcus]|uniref:Uncharacterized protein n=1 Tax=Prochlorococcus marinus (strain SARG / CCMP1375 / SS120) TaxID=167539 RepID=Q7VA18_PROMA|nr:MULTISPECIES: hypothetical protein [Prochlorococcus]AAQ00695.1 Predicted protein [Prochlorococcus marinus subsp. marinus str. CCMP1375]